METNYKITIPKPCHEDWNNMTPDQTGRFCNSCAKSVVDFTNMKAPEIQEFFIKNQGKSVCGRFKNEQLDSIIIQIPREVLYTQVQFHKMFMLALLISMGTTLFSCQNANGNKQKIDGVEVVDSAKEIRTMGEPMPEKVTEEEHLTGDTTYTPDKTKKEVKTVSYKKEKVELITNGSVAVEPKDILLEEPKTNIEDVATKTNDSVTKLKKARLEELRKLREIRNQNDRGSFIAGKTVIHSNDATKVQDTVKATPHYPGGLTKFYEYFNSNFKAPEAYKNVTARLFVSFLVNKDGSLSDIRIRKGINEAIDKEVLRVVEASPKWIPGAYKGEKAITYYTLPLKITAQ